MIALFFKAMAVFRARLSHVIAAVALCGCAPPVDVPGDGGSGGGVTYTKDVRPILVAKCSPCHAGQRQGFHNIVTNYEDVHKNVESLDSLGCWKDVEMMMPKTVGECALISIMNGRMPLAMGCFIMPDKPTCVTPAERDVVAAWVAAGMPQ